MNISNQELEVKFYLNDLPRLSRRLEQAEAILHHPRVRETNLRFDTPDGALTSARRVLRLRQDERIRLTYKGPAMVGREVSARPEIEFEASNFDNARAFLEALGYVVSIIYEKYRTTYLLDGTEIVLDELPFGCFAEIEGGDEAAIQRVALRLGLNWEARCIDSYLGLFNRLCLNQGLAAKNLSFDEVQQQYPAEVFGLTAGDA